MENVINGKTLVFADIHCGLAGNRLSRLNICAKVIKEILTAVDGQKIDNIVFLGDWYHSRTMLDVNTINVSLRLVQALARKAKLYLICGNHDAFLKNSTDINSLNMFRNTKNVTIIDKPYECSMNGDRCLLVPWLTDLSVYGEQSFDIMMGHFEISSKYLIQSYIEDNSRKRGASESILQKIQDDSLLGNDSVKQKASDLVGNFVDLVKRDGIIYAGHIHKHKEFIAKGRQFIFVGSPYQQTFGEAGCECGYYILDSRNSRRFIPIETVPKYIKVLMSEAVRPGYDFSAVSGNIIQKVYDIDVDQKTEAAVNQKITDFKPYEELVSDYKVSIDCSQSQSSGTIELIRKSKLDYIRNYIDNMDEKALSEQKVERGKLFDIMQKYYNAVTEK